MNVGEVANTAEPPLPVLSVSVEKRLALEGAPMNVETPVAGVTPRILATVGKGYEPDKSPPAVPVGDPSPLLELLDKKLLIEACHKHIPKHCYNRSAIQPNNSQRISQL